MIAIGVEEISVCGGGGGFEVGGKRNYKGRKSTSSQSTARETRRLGNGKRRRHRRCNVIKKRRE